MLHKNQRHQMTTFHPSINLLLVLLATIKQSLIHCYQWQSLVLKLWFVFMCGQCSLNTFVVPAAHITYVIQHGGGSAAVSVMQMLETHVSNVVWFSGTLQVRNASTQLQRRTIVAQWESFWSMTSRAQKLSTTFPSGCVTLTRLFLPHFATSLA